VIDSDVRPRCWGVHREANDNTLYGTLSAIARVPRSMSARTYHVIDGVAPR